MAVRGFNDNLRVETAKHADEKYGVYDSLAEAKSEIIEKQRPLGLTVGIVEAGSVVEYWWKSGVTDNDLVEKIPSASSVNYWQQSNSVDLIYNTGKVGVGYNVGDTLPAELSVNGHAFVLNQIQLGLEDNHLEGGANSVDLTVSGSAHTKFRNDGDLEVLAGSIIASDLSASESLISVDSSGKLINTTLGEGLNFSGGQLSLDSSLLNQLENQGAWDASTNTPAIPAASASNNGHFYIASSSVSAGHGYANIPDVNYNAGDWLLSNGTSWQRIKNSSATQWIQDGSDVYYTGGVVMIGKSSTSGTYSLDVLGDSLFTGGVVSTGTIEASGGDSVDWNLAYANHPTDLTFNSSTGALTLSRFGNTNLTESLDGRYVLIDDLNYYQGWDISDGTNSETVSSGASVTFSGLGIVSTSYDGLNNEMTISASESDPVFTASPAGGITGTQISNWDTAFGWGDWSVGVDKAFVDALDVDAGTLGSFAVTRFMILDAVIPTFATGDVPVAQSDGTFTNQTLAAVALSNDYQDLSNKPAIFQSFDLTGDSGTGTVQSLDNITFSGLGIVSTSYDGISNEMTISATETDPVFSASAAAGIVGTDITNWDEAYSWGDHALAGYRTAAQELSWDNPLNGNLTLTDGSVTIDLDDRYYTEDEVDTLINNVATYSGWNLAATTGGSTFISENETVTFIDGLNTTATRLGNTIQIDAAFSETDTLQSVTNRGATTTQSLTVGGLNIPEYIHHDGDNSYFGFQSNDTFWIGLSGSAFYTFGTTQFRSYAPVKFDSSLVADGSASFGDGISVTDTVTNVIRWSRNTGVEGVLYSDGGGVAMTTNSGFFDEALYLNPSASKTQMYAGGSIIQEWTSSNTTIFGGLVVTGTITENGFTNVNANNFATFLSVQGNIAVTDSDNSFVAAQTFNSGIAETTSITLDGILIDESDDRAGLLEVHRDGSNSWSGYAIDHSGQHWSFMGNSTNFGLYDDTNGNWHLYAQENSWTRLYHNGNVKLETASNGVSVTGTVTATAFSGDGANIDNITAEDALKLDGFLGTDYARKAINNNFTTSQSIAGNLTLTGTGNILIDGYIKTDDPTSNTANGVSSPTAENWKLGSVHDIDDSTYNYNGKVVVVEVAGTSYNLMVAENAPL